MNQIHDPELRWLEVNCVVCGQPIHEVQTAMYLGGQRGHVECVEAIMDADYADFVNELKA